MLKLGLPCYNSKSKQLCLSRFMKICVFTNKVSSSLDYLYNKTVRPTKNEPQQQGISYLEREREGVRERGAAGKVSRQAYLR